MSHERNVRYNIASQKYTPKYVWVVKQKSVSPSIDTLPDDVLNILVDLLSGLELAVLNFVSKKWKQLVQKRYEKYTSKTQRVFINLQFLAINQKYLNIIAWIRDTKFLGHCSGKMNKCKCDYCIHGSPKRFMYTLKWAIQNNWATCLISSNYSFQYLQEMHGHTRYMYDKYGMDFSEHTDRHHDDCF